VIYNYIIIFLISSVKFIFAFPLAINFELDIFHIFCITVSGGLFGIVIFSFLSDFIIKIWTKVFIQSLINKNLTTTGKQQKRIRKYINIKNKYGLIGISLLSPILLSIPLGTFLAVKFFGRKLSTILYLSFFVIVWGGIFSIIVKLDLFILN